MPSLSSTTAPAPTSGTGAIRIGIALLGAIGFALSYDALRQMAVAIHIRGLLTYAFPLVIDGFIAIGVRALLILRTAPSRSRLYVWALVGLATATSIWANALHAIRLNQQTRHTGLHLDDLTVGALSAIAPLALAGAVHLYLVIQRHTTSPRHRQEDSTTHRHIDTSRHDHQPTGRPHPTHSDDEPEHLETALATSATDVAGDADDVAEEPLAKPKGRQPSATIDELVGIGRTAPPGRDGRISRRAVETAIRAKGHSVGRARLDEATHILQGELDTARAKAD
ncbi:DUF2637 domain-containing protein [Streptomyces sp. NPDC005962]|uniref:DUF2637 domain-containing protein n=1 Tax=Streptomyces sp. NPDC005962 TaxID=3154466 RepID=UPI00340CEC9B